MKWTRILARDALLLTLDVAGIVAAVAWCRAAGCDERWMTGTTTMTLRCVRCARTINTVPRS